MHLLNYKRECKKLKDAYIVVAHQIILIYSEYTRRTTQPQLL